MEAFGKIGKESPKEESEWVRLRMRTGLGTGRANDAFQNVVARMGFGTPSVPEGVDYPLVRWSLNYWLMVSLYRNHWISRRIVDTAAADMVRAWPTINSSIPPDDLGRFEKVLRRTRTKNKILQAIKWGRLYGGSGALIVIEGHEGILDQPLDLDEIDIGSYKGLIPFDRWQGIWPDSELQTDLEQPLDFGLPKYYRVETPNAQSFKVHCSRVLRFIGPDVPAPEYQAQSYWGISVLEPAFEEIRKRDNLSWAILNLSFRSSILAQKNPELAAMLSGAAIGGKGLTDFYTRMQLQNELLSNQNMMVLGKEGELFSVQQSMTGWADVYQQFQLDIAGAAQTPVARLFGRTISGLGQTNDADERVYEEHIAQEQHQNLEPQLDKLFPVICMSEFGDVPDDFDYNFPSVRVLTEEEKADLAKTWTDAVAVAFSEGLTSQKLSLKELQQQSKTTGIFTNIDDETIESADDEVVPRGEMMVGKGQEEEFPEPKPESPGSELNSEDAEAGKVIPAEGRGAAEFITKPGTKVDTYAGIPITVEHKRGSIRTIRNDHGLTVYRRKLANDYGFIRDTVGRDGDEIDVILGPDRKADRVWIVDMQDLGPDVNEREDEDKVMLGFPDRDSAVRAFAQMYDESWIAGMEELSLDDFKENWLQQAAEAVAA